MRILIDGQTLSTTDINRGIGIYFLNVVYSLVKLAPKNDIFIGTFDDYNSAYIRPISNNIKIISLGKRLEMNMQSREEYDSKIIEIVKKYDIDIFWIPNPVMENVHLIKTKPSCKIVITLYDLIPLIFEDVYLKNWPRNISNEYISKLIRIERISDIVVTISESTKKDLIDILEIDPLKLEIIYPGIKKNFIGHHSEEKNLDNKEYLLYVGGFDQRKNMENAVLSFKNLIEKYDYKYLDFIIVCQYNDKTPGFLNFLNFLKRIGIYKRIKLTGYIPEKELTELYKNAKAFFFPSLYEGFGLPILEAMMAGIPIAASNTSSIPEVLDGAGLLFDPENIDDMVEKLNIVLSNKAIAYYLREKGKNRASQFSWDQSAREILQIFANLTPSSGECSSKMKLAYFSCLSPLRSGISDYSEELLPYLSKYIDIDIYIDSGYRPSNKKITDKFRVFNYKEIKNKIDQYDAILYQMGNGKFHTFMYETLMIYKGIVVFHDIFMHGLISEMTITKGYKKEYIEEFKYCYGEKGKIVAENAIKSGSYPYFEYPLLKRMLDNSLGAIVHSEFGKNIILGEKKDINIVKINQPMPMSKNTLDKNIIRKNLRIGKDDIIIVSFGHIFPHKRIDRAIGAFAEFHKKFPNSKYFLIGQSHDNGNLDQLIEKLGIKNHVIFTGFLPLEKAMEYITAADICINLRYPTAGETSSSALRVLGIGRPIVVSNVGWFSELPDNCSAKVDIDNYEEDLILEYLNVLISNEKLRIKMGENAKNYILNECDPEKIAHEYYTFIAKFKRFRHNKRNKITYEHSKTIRKDKDDNKKFFDDINIEKFSNEAWLKLAYICLLQRHIDDVGYEYWSNIIKEGTFNYKNLIDTLINSPEHIMHFKIPFYNKRNFDDINIEKFSNEDWLKLAYICLLQRHIDDVGYEYWSNIIKEGTFNYKNLIDTLINSPEHIMHFKIPFYTMLHRSRQEWIKELNYFDSILDIGGSSGNIEMGALIELGYPHKPKSIMIFDLPPEEQYWGVPKVDQTKCHNFSWGSVEYIHGYAENIDQYEKLKLKTFDCIFMGQTIEHIEPEQLTNILIWIKKHLKQNGKFIFDTPNRSITKIQSPNAWIDQYHKYEYTPEEMENILSKNSFRVIKRWGILDMPITSSTRKFNPLEVYESRLLTKNPESSYCFAFECDIEDFE